MEIYNMSDEDYKLLQDNSARSLDKILTVLAQSLALMLIMVLANSITVLIPVPMIHHGLLL